MILSDGDIRRRLREGDLVIEPLADPDLQIQPASVDFRLGREFLEFKRTNITCIHPDRGEEVEKYVSETTVPPDGEQTTLGEDAGPGEFILHPGDFVLGTTIERVELPNDLIAHVEGRSSLGRLAIVVHASLPADEEVFLWTPSEGFGFYEIGDIVEDERSARAVSFDPRTLRVRTHRVTDFITNPSMPIYRVTLASGRRVHVTKDHNLFTLDEHGGVTRIPSEEAVGSYVMIPNTLPEPQAPMTTIDLLDAFEGADSVTAYASDGVGSNVRERLPSASSGHSPSPNGPPGSALPRAFASDRIEVAFARSETRLPRHLPVTETFGWMLGFYIVAGSADGTQVTFRSADGTNLDRLSAWFDRFEAELSRSAAEHGVEILTVSSALWSTLLRTLVGSSRGKSVPGEAWDWSNDVLEALLDGLVDGASVRGEPRKTILTRDPTLVDRTMYLASRLGVASRADRVNRDPNSGKGACTHVGPHWAIDLGEGQQDADPTRSIPVPTQLLRDLRSAAGWDRNDAAAAMGYPSSRISTLECGQDASVDRATLRRIRDTYANAGAETRRLDHLLEGDIRFDRVVSVEKTDRVEPTYDLEVQPNGRAIENFIGGRGGVFLSNTAGIVDPGYRGQITLELSNLGSAPVALQPGMRISQLTFTELKTPAERPYGSERGSKYQDQTGPQASRIGGDDEFAGDQQ